MARWLAPLVALALAAVVVGTGACASVLGFDDLSLGQGGAGGGGGDGGPPGDDSGADGNNPACVGLCGTVNTGTGFIDCGGCPNGQSCGAGGPNVCGPGQCTPNCAGKACGQSNDCDGICQSGLCASGLRCSAGQCVCDYASCSGCCQGGQCQIGTDPTACGVGGNQCQVCTGSQTCSSSGGCSAGVVTLFGGYGTGGYLNDTWTWDGNLWTQVDLPDAGTTPLAPSVRYASAMANLGGKVVLFGGNNGSMLADTWIWDGSVWTPSQATGPSGRYSASMAVLNGQAVLFGGFDSTSNGTQDTWGWNGSAWSLLSSTGPSPRGAAMMATFGNEIVLVGGSPSTGLTQLGDAWVWNGSTWTPLSATPPPARTYSAGSALTNGIMLFGGYSTPDGGSAGPIADSWWWDGASSSWTSFTASQTPPARYGAAGVPFQGKLLMFGGYNTTYLQDTWSSDGASWTQLATTSSNLPPGRYAPSMTGP